MYRCLLEILALHASSNGGGTASDDEDAPPTTGDANYRSYLRTISRDLTYAAIDIGSNAVRLLIGDVVERDDHPVIKKTSLVRVPIRLGADVFDNGAISPAKRDQLIKSLKAFRLLTEVHGAHYLRCCATSAMREATNSAEVLARVEKESGIHIEMIDGRTEADLIMSTFWTQDLLKDRSYLYIDVGGGSTELTWIANGRRKHSSSFKVGTVRLLQHKVDESEWVAMSGFLSEIRSSGAKLTAIGTGGNINRIFKENRNGYGEPLSRADIRKQRDRIAAYSFEDRVKQLRLRPDRADVIIPAANIFLRVMEEAGIEEVFVPKVGLADGIVYDLYTKQYGKAKYAAQPV